jgi:NADH-quinone oxidoreductase subunit N
VNLHLLLPEILVVFGALAVVTADLLAKPEHRARIAPWVAGSALVAALLVLVLLAPDGSSLRGHHRSDAFSLFVRGIALGGGLLLVLLSAGYTRRMDRGHGEFYGLLLFALLGVMLVSGVTDLMGLFVCLELVTISSYVLAAFKRADVESTEAGLKYLLVGAVSSAFLLFGCALVYGASGTVDFATLSAHVAGKGFSPLLSLGTGLVLVGLFFKISAVPFHVWAPDVYQGAPSPVTAFLSSLSKSAGFVLILRVLAVLVVPIHAKDAASRDAWIAFFGVVAGVTLLYGNLGAIAQRDVKRLLAYSSIGHAGYMLLGVAAIAAAPVGDERVRIEGATAVLVYLFAYYVTTMTAFAVVTAVSKLGRGHDAATTYAGLHRRAPLLAFAMLLALLSLAGVPPMAGLIGKFLVFYALVDAAQTHPGLILLGFLGALGVVLSLYYYLLLIREMYVKEPSEGSAAPRLAIPRGSRAAVVLGVVALVLFGVYWAPVYDAAHRAALALFAVR